MSPFDTPGTPDYAFLKATPSASAFGPHIGKRYALERGTTHGIDPR